MECGKDNSLLNITKIDYNYWNKISVISLFGGECQSFYEDKEQKNIIYFNMSMKIIDEKITYFLNENKKIRFVQKIRAPVYLKYKIDDFNILINSKEYAYCKNEDLIDKIIIKK